MSTTEKLPPNERRELISKCVTELCNGLGLRVEDARIAFYAKALDDLSAVQLEHGFDIAKRNLGAFLPAVEQIRQWAESWRPAGYEAEFDKLEKSMLTKAAVHLKVTKAEIDGWLQAAKDREQVRIDALKADPEWQEMYSRLRQRDFVKPSRVPSDPDERKAWHTANIAPWRKER